MKLYELFSDVKTVYGLDENKDIEIGTIVSDSRRAVNGCLFVCLRGLKSDGHDHIKDAVSSGAVAVVIEEGRNTECGVPVICVKNTRRALSFLWNNYFGRPSEKLDIIAVTGTNGKTSTTYFLREIFNSAGYKTGLVGTVNCYVGDKDVSELKRSESLNDLANMTTPDPESLYGLLAIMAEEGVEVVFMEATSHALALHKLDALKIKVGVFTNLTPDHLDFHGNMENYFFAKSRLFSMCEKGIINLDDEYGARIVSAAGCEVYTCSSAGIDADFRAEEIINLGVAGVEYLFASKKSVYRIKSPIPGSFTVKNTLAAASVASLYGIHMTTVQDSLKGLCGIIGRMERVKTGNADFSVFIDYAHTPDALENLLSSVRELCTDKERIILVFGCGGDRDKTKRPMMGEIATRFADRVIITSDNCRSEDSVNIIFDILGGVDKSKDFAAIADRREAIEYAISCACARDVIILAGKGHEKYEIKENKRLSFDEREIVRDAISKYHEGV